MHKQEVKDSESYKYKVRVTGLASWRGRLFDSAKFIDYIVRIPVQSGFLNGRHGQDRVAV